jgi:acylphosphatase
MEMKAKEIMIKGKVHDVGYRLFLLSEAERLFIEKFDARDVLINGEEHLIVLVEGAEEKINRFVEFAESNYPPEASVESVEVKDYGEEVRSIDSFRQSFMVFQLTKIAQAGVGMLGKQDKTIEILESVKGDTSKMLEKQDETIKVIKEEGEKTRDVLKGKIFDKTFF